MRWQSCVDRVSVGLLIACVHFGCSPQRAFTEWFARKPEAVRFGCPSGIAPADPPSLAVVVVLEDVRSGDELSSFAGDLDQPPLSLPVPFSDATPPLTVLRSDLERILSMHSPPTTSGSGGAPLRLDATLHMAFTDRIFYFVRSSEMRGRVVFDFAIRDPLSGRTSWVQRVSGEHRVHPAYVTSRSVQDALAGAYCQALAAFGVALESEELQEAVRP